jgi:membrane associated rhomboid family serine protease
MQRLIDDIKLMAGLLALLWAVLLVDMLVFGGSLVRFGIVPRQLSGLIGIPLAPLLHLGPVHLLANSGPFFVLGLLALRQGRAAFAAASTIIIVLGGFATWCIGPAQTVHVGASGLIFGWFGFVVAAAWQTPRLSAVLAAFLALFWYGFGILFGLSPLQLGVSWQGHLTGLLAGIAAAWVIAGAPRRSLPPAERRRLRS